MLQVSGSWCLDVDRGPDWLFVRVAEQPREAEDAPPLADTLWSLLEQHFTYRLVLECDALRTVNSNLIGQLVLLHKRIYKHGGLMRLAGLSDDNFEVLRQARLDRNFPRFYNRAEAVLGHRPLQPR